MEKQKKQYIPNTIGGWKRFLSYFADVCIFLILSITIFSVISSPLSKVITPYKTYDQNTRDSYNSCVQFALDSKLIELDDEGNERNALLTLEDDLKRFVNNETYDNNGGFAEIFTYFYLDYLPNNMTLESVMNYDLEYINIYIFKVNEASSLFEKVDDTYSKIPTLKSESKQHLEEYFNNDINSNSQRAYDNAMELFKTNWTDATNLLTQCSEFQELSRVYNLSNNKVLNVYSATSLITFTICFFLYYLLVPVLFGKGQTFAKKIMHQKVAYEDGKPLLFKTLLVRSILLFIFSLFLYVMLPIFEVGVNVINLPLFMIGDYIVYSFSPCVITLICAVISFAICNNSLNHQSLHDLVLHTVVLKDNPDYVETVEEEKKEDF